ncbi:hypothetical protein [Duncaniella dubosii]
MRSKEIGSSPFEYERKSSEMLNLLSDFVRTVAQNCAENPQTSPS